MRRRVHSRQPVTGPFELQDASACANASTTTRGRPVRTSARPRTEVPWRCRRSLTAARGKRVRGPESLAVLKRARSAGGTSRRDGGPPRLYRVNVTSSAARMDVGAPRGAGHRLRGLHQPERRHELLLVRDEPDRHGRRRGRPPWWRPRTNRCSKATGNQAGGKGPMGVERVDCPPPLTGTLAEGRRRGSRHGGKGVQVSIMHVDCFVPPSSGWPGE